MPPPPAPRPPTMLLLLSRYHRNFSHPMYHLQLTKGILLVAVLYRECCRLLQTRTKQTSLPVGESVYSVPHVERRRRAWNSYPSFSHIATSLYSRRRRRSCSVVCGSVIPRFVLPYDRDIHVLHPHFWGRATSNKPLQQSLFVVLFLSHLCCYFFVLKGVWSFLSLDRSSVRIIPRSGVTRIRQKIA